MKNLISLAILLLVAALGTGCATPHDQVRAEVRLERCVAPCPPESIAGLMDTLMENRTGNVSVRLLHDPEAAQIAAWVFMADGKPVWVVRAPAKRSDKKTSGITARAIRRAREFIADQKERTGLGTEYHLALARLMDAAVDGRRPPVTQDDINRLMEEYRNHRAAPKDRKTDKAYTTCDHQTNVYGLQIEEMTLLDKESESWAITVRPVAIGTMGGELWLRFDREHEVSCEFGR